MAGRKVIFLDRDGTINVDHGYVHKITDWKFCDRAPEAMHALEAAGYLLAVVTNQSGIGHGLYTEEDMHRLNEHMQSELKKHGVTLSAIAYCPHHREANCSCRKPLLGMLDQMKAELNEVDFSQSWSIGDKPLDLDFGKNAGTKTILICSRYWQMSELKNQPDFIVDSLYAAAQKILN